ncbi:hypothetical protein BCR35DRAFT_300020 [Leucosporidium creatinivorum]|uniref:F-box domain-containing protein n=1 Tax=Leucosporidium creatinivorum TaxID=106004 RepID=A0A1Y2FZM8_9BASI|nr:hypothetical protein BCR35DRAFT_300020 [Leucosporidium creatinivorum]
MPALPTEIILQIFANVAESYAADATLKACALVSRSFLDPARDFLYAQVSATFVEDRYYKLAPAFPIVEVGLEGATSLVGVAQGRLSSVAAYPHLAPRVRSVILRDETFNVKDEDALRDTYNRAVSMVLAYCDGATALKLVANSAWAINAVALAIAGKGEQFSKLEYREGHIHLLDDAGLERMASQLPLLLRQLSRANDLALARIVIKSQSPNDQVAIAPILRLAIKSGNLTSFAAFTSTSHFTLRTLTLTSRRVVDISLFVNLRHLSFRGPSSRTDKAEALTATLLTAPTSLKSLELRTARLLSPNGFILPPSVEILTMELADLPYCRLNAPSSGSCFFRQLCALVSEPNISLQRLNLTLERGNDVVLDNYGYSAEMRDLLAQACVVGGVACERPLPVVEFPADDHGSQGTRRE